MVIFTLEHPVRIWTCSLNHHFSHPVTGRIRVVLKPLSLVDLLAILPFRLNLAGITIILLRIFRLLKFVRLVKYSKAYHCSIAHGALTGINEWNANFDEQKAAAKAD